MPIEETICAVCGAGNTSSSGRCRSCGAKIIQLHNEFTEEELYARRHQQDSFHWKWVAISCVMFICMAAVVIGVAPRLISVFDPQGFSGVMIVISMWFIGGMIVNFLSPDKTFFEPAVGGLLAAFPAMALLSSIADVYQLSTMSYAISGLMAVMMALMGAFVGDKLKGDAPPKPRPRRLSGRPRKA